MLYGAIHVGKYRIEDKLKYRHHTN